MKISIFRGTQSFEAQYVDSELVLHSLADLAQAICKSMWSPFLFTADDETNKPHRLSKCFKEITVLSYDIDDNLTVQEAIERCQGIAVVIATTRHHHSLRAKGASVSITQSLP